MFGKRLRFMTVLAAALGIPYAWFNENFSGTLKTKWQMLKASASPGDDGGQAVEANGESSWLLASTGTEKTPTATTTPSQVPLIRQLPDVLRFDIDTRWVTQNWSRVSTVHADQGLEGLRVALVTGTKRDDVTGALTYYFDAEHRVRRITLYGQTADERPLVELVSNRFGLRAEPSLGAGLYVRRWNGKPKNALRVSHAPVVRSNSPFGNLFVELEINDLSANYGLSPQFAQVLNQ